MKTFDLLFGKPIATVDEHNEHIGVAAGIPIFGLDGLTSAAYGPEAAMALLIPLGLVGVQHYLLPIFGLILTLLVILYFSYRQTITAYPNGGGSYTVASENLGDGAGLLAAAALMIDYILTAAVGISAGVTALVSATEGTKFGPVMHHYQLAMCLLILALIALVNMRGVKESGFAFMLPTFLFVGTLMITIGLGVARTLAAHGTPIPVAAPPAPVEAFHALKPMVLLWLLMKAFSNGCAAMTGVEAVSNGTPAFKEPRSKNANKTLTAIIAMLLVLLLGLSYIARSYQITAMDPDATNYQSVLSLTVAAVFGRGWFYFLTMGSVLAALSFSANTAFADFPRMARAIGGRDYLPHVFLIRGRRLLFSHGIFALTGFTALILILFNGVTDRLIPLYAIGAFLAFTLSQAGMVKHWLKEKDAPGRHFKMFLNGLGATATGITLLIVLVTKFFSGAWVTALLVPLLILLMLGIRRHYRAVYAETSEEMGPIHLENLDEPIVVIPMDGWTKISEKALRFGMLMSKDVKVVHTETPADAAENPASLDRVWEKMVAEPAREAEGIIPSLVRLPENLHATLLPVMHYIFALEEEHPTRKIAVLLPELVVRRRWENLLHNRRVQLLKLLLLVKGNQRIVVINIPWYL